MVATFRFEACPTQTLQFAAGATLISGCLAVRTGPGLRSPATAPTYGARIKSELDAGHVAEKTIPKP